MAKGRKMKNKNSSFRQPDDSVTQLCPVFSAAYLRRKIAETISCGSSFRRSIEQRKSTILTISEPVNERKKSESLSELFRSESMEEKKDNKDGSENDVEIMKKVERLQEMERIVKELQTEETEHRRKKKLAAAAGIRMAAKEDAVARVTLAMLGAIPPLVGMLDTHGDSVTDETESVVEALYALLNLGIGNDLNKAAIVKAGAIHKMLQIVTPSNSINSINKEILEAVVANFLGLTALDRNKLIVGSSGAIPVLSGVLKTDSPTSKQCKHDALRALYNLSLSPLNSQAILDAQLVPLLLQILGDPELSDRILAALGNIVATPEGRRAVSATEESFAILIDVLSWADLPGCQEKSAYVLMIMAHKNYNDRRAMVESGIMSALLELMLVGSALSQKRASRILEFLRNDKGKQLLVDEINGGAGGISGVSEPIIGFAGGGGGEESLEGVDASSEMIAVNKLVQQSLLTNMRRIAKRANLNQDFTQSERFRNLTASSTSKSLPLP